MIICIHENMLFLRRLDKIRHRVDICKKELLKKSTFPFWSLGAGCCAKTWCSVTRHGGSHIGHHHRHHHHYRRHWCHHSHHHHHHWWRWWWRQCTWWCSEAVCRLQESPNCSQLNPAEHPPSCSALDLQKNYGTTSCVKWKWCPFAMSIADIKVWMESGKTVSWE